MTGVWVGIGFLVAALFLLIQSEGNKWHGPWREWLAVSVAFALCGVVFLTLGIVLE